VPCHKRALDFGSNNHSNSFARSEKDSGAALERTGGERQLFPPNPRYNLTFRQFINHNKCEYWVIQNDCGQVWQLCTKIYVATVWMR
jgi:hypothetical protein